MVKEAGERSWGRRLLRMLVLVAVFYAAVCGLMMLFEPGLLFHPTNLPTATRDLLVSRSDVERLIVPSDGVELRGFFVRGEGEAPRPAILYFGGNAERVWRRVEAPPGEAEGRFNRVYVSHRGYDDSGGEPSARRLLADALAIYDAVARRDDVDDAVIVPWGVSLGTGMAVHIARERPVAGVILLAPYDRLAEVAAGHYPFLPVRFLMRNDIDSLSKAPATDAPVLIIHGDADGVIPADHSRALADRWAGASERVVLPGVGHDDLWTHPETRAAIEAFLDRFAPAPEP
jgi:pimeloyl-ACP methyl ester carboxylesterase